MSWKLPVLRIAPIAAAMAIVLTGVNSGARGQSSLFPDQDKPLFSGSLFPDEDITTSLDREVSPQIATNKAAAAPSVGAQINDTQIDDEFRRQLRSVAHWLQLYGVRNGSRFPGLQNDEGWAAQVQLTELVPNNPYNYGPTETAFAGMGIAATYNQNGSPKTGSPVWGDDYTTHLQAQNNNRVVLSMDYSLTPQIIDEWAKHPPQEWTGTPGQIFAESNNQGLYIVWGAGRDGKPLRNPMNGNAFIVAGSTSGNVNDTSAPNQ